MDSQYECGDVGFVNETTKINYISEFPSCKVRIIDISNSETVKVVYVDVPTKTANGVSSKRDTKWITKENFIKIHESITQISFIETNDIHSNVYLIQKFDEKKKMFVFELGITQEERGYSIPTSLFSHIYNFETLETPDDSYSFNYKCAFCDQSGGPRYILPKEDSVLSDRVAHAECCKKLRFSIHYCLQNHAQKLIGSEI